MGVELLRLVAGLVEVMVFVVSDGVTKVQRAFLQNYAVKLKGSSLLTLTYC